MIYTFDAKGFILYPVMKSALELSDQDVYKAIQDGFEVLQKQLKLKRISYDQLRGALVPNQEKDRFETCFVFDSEQINSADYGYCVFEKLLPLLDKDSTYSILCGDYIDYLNNYHYDSQRLLRSEMAAVLTRCHESQYVHSSQYYLIYINRLTGSQRLKIVEGLYPYSWFTGFADLTHSSPFKSYLSNILTPVCVKNKNKIIVSHPSDYADEENVNMRGFPFESNGFKLLSVNDDSYGAFLSYKIESELPDKDDVSFSFNALFPKFDSFEKIDLQISDDKWNKYLIDKEKGKGRIVESLGYATIDKERFAKDIFKHMCANYIYYLRKNEHDGALLMNTCVELPTINGHLRKTTVALKYLPDTGTVEVVTIT